MTVPTTRAARHQRIIEILRTEPVSSQAQLSALLTGDGIVVTQATLSRDLDELGASKAARANGRAVYAVPADGPDAPSRSAESATSRLARVAEELMVGVDHSANIVVVRTPPGAAQFLASAVDHTVLSTVIGTVAGDDTVLLVTRDPDGGAAVAADLLALVDRHR